MAQDTCAHSLASRQCHCHLWRLRTPFRLKVEAPRLLEHPSNPDPPQKVESLGWGKMGAIPLFCQLSTHYLEIDSQVSQHNQQGSIVSEQGD